MIRPSPELVQCPHCHIQNFAIDDKCVGCGQSLTVTIGPRPRLRRMNLQTVMILIGVIAVCLAGLRENLGVFLVLTAVLIPTTIRGLLMIEERKADGRPMIWPQQLEAFSTSCLVSLVIVMGTMLAFTITCFPIGLMTLDLGRGGGSGGIMVAFLAGGASAIFVIYSLGKRLWPRKD